MKKFAFLALAGLLAACGGNSTSYVPIRLPNPQQCVGLNTPLQNGSFQSGDFTCWGQATLATGAQPGHPIFSIFSRANPQGSCLPSLPQNEFFANLDTPAGADAYIFQFFTIPAGATTLSLKTWVTGDPTTAIISIVDSNTGVETVLDNFVPPSVTNNTPGACTGNSPVVKNYNIASFAGKLITLKLRSTGNGQTNAMVNYTEIKVI